jgi:transcriptional regulator with XRE-family HTH domain
MARIDMASVGEYIREQRAAAQLSLRQLAQAADVSNPYLSQVERGLRKPSAEILAQIAKALQISAESLYVRAGILEPRQGDPSVTAALAGDATLTDRQRQSLLEIYAAFQSENAAHRGPEPQSDTEGQSGTVPPAETRRSARPRKDK